MKKIIPILACIIGLLSCTKEGTTTVTPVTSATPSPVAGSFTWKENGVAYTADSAWFYGSPSTRIQVYSGAGANQRSMTISFPATTIGVYPIPATYFPYAVGGTFTTATSGTLTITTYDNSNNKLSGSFSNVIAGSYTLTDGTFTNLPKR